MCTGRLSGHLSVLHPAVVNSSRQRALCVLVVSLVIRLSSILPLFVNTYFP